MPAHRIPLHLRFWSKVDKSAGPDSCWPWLGCTSNGYGQIWSEGKMQKANRVAYELGNGATPGDLCVCHYCDNPLCCNPNHLWLGTNQENTADRQAKGRQSRGDSHVSRLRPEVMRRGEVHGMAKLTEAQAAEILTRGLKGEAPASIAADFPVSRHMVGRIVSRKNWKHLEVAA